MKDFTSRSRRNQNFYDFDSLLSGVEDGKMVKVADRIAGCFDFQEGDMLLIDRQRSRRKGDLVVWEDFDGLLVSRHEDMDFRTLRYVAIHGVVLTLIRDFRKRPKRSRAKRARTQNRELKKLQEALAKMERLPENEAERFKLKTEIYKIERENASADEWPEVIGGNHA